MSVSTLFPDLSSKRTGKFLLILFLKCACAQLLSHVQLFATAWTVAHQTSLSMG